MMEEIRYKFYQNRIEIQVVNIYFWYLFQVYSKDAYLII